MFLPERESRTITITEGDLQHSAELFLGQGGMPLEVVSIERPLEPTVPELRRLFEARMGRRAAPVLLVINWGDERSSIYGPTSQNALCFPDLHRQQVERICEVALYAPYRHDAVRFLYQELPQLEAPIPGLRNSGLFALQELIAGVPDRGDWKRATEKSEPLRQLRGRELIKALDFETEETPGPTLLLYASGTKTAVAILLERQEEIDAKSTHFDDLTPISYALAQADREGLGYVVVCAGPTIRVYATDPGIGTGRRGRIETFVELNLDLLADAHSAYLLLLCSAAALKVGGTFQQILKRSEDYAAELGGRLRERVYAEVVPQLAEAVIETYGDQHLTRNELDEAYQLALRILFRLLFVAYAEDKDLLPLHNSTSYREHSLKRIAQRLAEARARGVEFGTESFYWTEVNQIWKAVDKGNPEWSVPAYDGGLFSTDPETARLGGKLADMSLPDRQFAPALAALLLDTTEESVEGPIDFRSLGVREFGTIYEGLLESELSVAEMDLTTEDDIYRPAGPKDLVMVAAGEPYLHNASGARKSTGSYYTKSFGVEHLLERALEPAVDEHLARLDQLGSREAGRKLFDFRVADIAMGSGHFLVAAIDRLERRFLNYLVERPLPEVTNELARLRKVAEDALGDAWGGDPIEDSQLIRRQIARRCIFGVDMNPLAVELARLSIWIHTFVPGLPLSLLDHNLVQGNSLVGVATFEEASELMQTGTGSLFSFEASERLGQIQGLIEKLAGLTDANDREIQEAREIYRQIRTQTHGESELLTALAASRTNSVLREAIEQGHLATDPTSQTDAYQSSLFEIAAEELAGLDALHFPLAFSHVFLRARTGFDVIVGNPPWEEATVEEDAFWARHFPGLRALEQREQERLKAEYREDRPDLVRQFEAERGEAEGLRKILTGGAFPGMGAGDPDLYKAFVWRFWHLVSHNGGRIGVVLPRSAMVAKGSGDFRKALLATAEEIDVTMLLNTGRWIFDMEPRYTIGLIVITRRAEVDESKLLLSGPYSSLERFQAGVVKEPATFLGSEVEAWNDDASFPLLPSDESVKVFAQLRKSPRLDLNDGIGWRARPHAELHATNDKPLMDLKSAECPEGFWPVFKGESFDIWTPDTGSYYAWADPQIVQPVLQRKRERANRRSPFSEFAEEWREDHTTLPCYAPRIAFRDVTRATDTRTVRAALLPPNIFVTNKGPYLLWPRGDQADQAYLLGVLCSIPFDWYARRFVETTLNFFIFNPFPVPRPDRDNTLWTRTVLLAGRLAAVDDRYAEWASQVGVESGPLEEGAKEKMINELDALVSRLYGLSEEELVHIFETFHVGWDYQDRLDATLHHFVRLGTST